MHMSRIMDSGILWWGTVRATVHVRALLSSGYTHPHPLYA